MRFSFRHRLFWAMVGLGTLPLAVALVVLGLQVRSDSSHAGVRAALDEIAASGRQLVSAVDTTALDGEAKLALHQHAEAIARRTTLARRAETLSRFAAGLLGFVIFVVAAVVLAASLGLARHWSRLVSAPIEEMVEWVRQVERHKPVPRESENRAAPEFEALQGAIRDMADALESARRRELEQERLQAFRETARKVAHEMRGPLTSASLAIRHLEKQSDPEMIKVLREETLRLEQMAQEFSEFGRLPEGPEADIDVGELLTSAIAATIPPGVSVSTIIPTSATIRGHYEPLRRALQNLLRNAVEASGSGDIDIVLLRDQGTVRVIISDHGPGIPPDLRARIFEPYFTTKDKGTGLGLALVRQTVEAHKGEITVEAAETGGARFVITLPEVV
jgi:two-component system nitrogen regulation sensor histidine kinase NtrY